MFIFNSPSSEISGVGVRRMADYEQGSKDEVPLQQSHIGFTVIQDLEFQVSLVCPHGSPALGYSRSMERF